MWANSSTSLPRNSDMAETPTSRQSPEKSENLRARKTFSFSQADLQAFAALSGDTNPIHLDDAVARDCGFEGRVVYGALIIAKISEVIGMDLPGLRSVWTDLKIAFHKPLFVNERAELEMTVTSRSEAAKLDELTFRVTKGDNVLVAKGKCGVYVGHV